MPIFGADYTEPDGSTFLRAQDDFDSLRKAVKEVDSEFKKNLKSFKSAIPCNPVSPRAFGADIGDKNEDRFSNSSQPV